MAFKPIREYGLAWQRVVNQRGVTRLGSPDSRPNPGNDPAVEAMCIPWPIGRGPGRPPIENLPEQEPDDTETVGKKTEAEGETEMDPTGQHPQSPTDPDEP